MLEVKRCFRDRLTEMLLKSWHHMLMENSTHISAGVYRTGNEPMQVISGAFGKEVVHYQAPPSDRI